MKTSMIVEVEIRLQTAFQFSPISIGFQIDVFVLDGSP
jgi:hypothetical protein